MYSILCKWIMNEMCVVFKGMLDPILTSSTSVLSFTNEGIIGEQKGITSLKP